MAAGVGDRTADRGSHGGGPSPPRLRGEDRRAALVDVAAALVAEGGVDAVSMEAVAAQAQVSRPLVYKHFGNRDQLLAAVFRQEAARLDAAIVAAVEREEGFEAKVRATIRATLDATITHGPTFAAFLRAGANDGGFREEQRARDRRTIRFFAELAMAEFDIGEAEARAGVAVFVAGSESIRAQWEATPTPECRLFLEDLYLDLVVGGLSALGRRRHPRPASRNAC